MMFRFLSLSAFLVACSSATSIPASSRLGTSLLSKARRLDDNNNGNNNNNNNNEEYAYTWVSGYSIRFHSCHTTLEFRADGGGSADDEDKDAARKSGRKLRLRKCQ